MSCITPVETIYDAPIKGEGHGPNWSRWLIYVVVMIVMKVCFRLRGEGLENLEKIPEGKAAVLAANHCSMIDPIPLFLLLKCNIRFLAKEELFEKNRFFTQIFARVGASPLKRNTADRSAIKRAVASLKRGEYLGIFPEGTRRKSREQELKNHAGAVIIANLAGVPIIPVGISGADKVLPEGSKVLHFPKIIVRFGEPVFPSDFSYLPKEKRNQAVIDEVMRRSFALRDDVPYDPSYLPGAEGDDA